jgi:parallel beta-helix repeat protein
MAQTVQTKTLVVPDQYPTIQSAIDHAGAGDTVFVKNGIYSENITINKAISVTGESTGKTIINGTGTVVVINSHNAVLDGFTIVCWNKWVEDYGNRVYYNDAFHLYRGISLRGSNCTVSNNIIVNAECGIDQFSASSNNLTNNTIVDSSYGISLGLSTNTKICGNIISNLWTAISLGGSSNNKVFDNSIFNQSYIGISLDVQSNYNEIRANNISNVRMYAIHIDNSSNNVISRNNIWWSNDSAIILSENVSSNAILSNFITSSRGGIIMWALSNSNISANYITKLNGAAIYGINLTNCRIMGNRLTNNGISITLTSYSTGNRIYSNDLSNNDNPPFFDTSDYEQNYIDNASIQVSAQIPPIAAMPNADIHHFDFNKLSAFVKPPSDSGNLIIPIVVSVFIPVIVVISALLFRRHRKHDTLLKTE